MRKILVLAALLAVMLGLRLFQSESVEQQSALVLAAIGFVLLVSFTVAEMGSALTLPRVTGYILTGALLAAFGILSPPVVLEMKMFNTLALGLIAISAGLELSLSQLKKVIGTLSATIAAKLALTVPLVAGAFYLFQTNWAPLALEGTENISAVALVLGALALGTSPAIALAIISETKSRGRLSDIVLGASVLKDLVVVIALAVAVAVARGLMAGPGGESGSLSHVFVEIGYSILAGGILGTLLILYIRYIKAEMLLFVAAMILVVAEVSHLLHLELLLVFIGGGFVVRNFSDYEHDLLHPVQMVSLPVFVVFFTIAGASIDLATTWRILPLALTLCAVRAVGYYFSAKFGNTIGKEAEPVRDNAWMGYLPQAGVTLGLVGLAATQLPSLSESILSTGMAVVAVNLLIGPIALRAALKRAGEIPTPQTQEKLEASEQQEAEHEGSAIEKLPEPIQAPFLRIESQLVHLYSETLKNEWGRWAKSAELQQRELANGLLDPDADLASLWRERRETEESLTAFAEECRELFLAARKIVRTLPDVVETPLEENNRRTKPDDSLAVVWKKRLAGLKRTFTFVRHPVRRVPVRELGRLHFEPRLAELCRTVWTSRLRLEAGALEDMEELVRGNIDIEEFEQRLTRRFDGWKRLIRQESRALARHAINALASQAAIVDSPYLPRSKVRASNAERSVLAALTGLDQGKAWCTALDATWASNSTAVLVRRFSTDLESAFLQGVRSESQRSLEAVSDVLVEWTAGLNRVARLAEAVQAPDEASEPAGAPTENASTTAEVITAFETFDADIHARGVIDFEKAMANFRTSLDLRVFAHHLESSLDRLPQSVDLILPTTSASTASSATDILYRRLEPRKLADKLLKREALLEIERAAEKAEEFPRTTSRALLGVFETTRIQVRAVAEEPDSALGLSRLKTSLEKGSEQVTEILDQLRSNEEAISVEFAQGLSKELRELERQLEQEGSSLSSLVRGRRFRLLLEKFTDRFGEAWQGTTRFLGAIERSLREAVRSELSLEVRAKFRAGDLDAGSVRAFLERHEPASELQDYVPFFLGGPLRDASHFVAHRTLLSQLLAAERSWISGGPASVLVVGDAGSGRTSLLNLLQHGSFSPSLVRPSPMQWRRKVGLLQALSYELGTRARPGAIEKALHGRQALIIIDDLEQWFPAGSAGVDALESFLDLVARTQKTAFWAISVSSPWFDLMSTVTEVAGSFGRVARLGPVSADELREAIERRQESTGREFRFPTTLLGTLLSRGRPERDKALFFKLLARASGGNLTRALGMWLHMAHLDENGVVRLRLSRALVVGLPFVRDLTAEQVALLVLLARHGPLSERELNGELCCGLPIVRRQLAFLRGASLLQGEEGQDSLIRVRRAWAPFLHEALHEVKAL